ncbi:peroxiredoxin [Nocardioides marmoriginsengisoli]|uniref:Alkyl hydroperoxide reductase E n=1 Tax=Nocardioides marmoriginsengisoli TaxID=661483 RepID=A0A3N0CLM4_9ACTN|nr:peroxiredoxin [Nocardioides marmoriginsengisoli]RNL64358.1 peroxiredoxin [Nocardioides marmoriginsengisoli]
MPIQVGAAAPDFTLRDQHGADFRLSSYAGKKAVLLVFYPFAFSGVCTGELTGFRDRLGDFETEHSTIAAISCDPIYSQRAFADRDGIFFPLLADYWPHGEVASAYGVFDTEQGCPQRSSFVIGKDGTVRWSVHNEMGDPRDLDVQAAALRDAI